jgi:tetratricopeptide (TPR) repeat protein
MGAPSAEQIRHRSRAASRLRARQWSRAAWSLAGLFASLPLASRIFLGVWGFDASAGIACLCLVVGTYLHILSRRSFSAIPDPASMLEEAFALAQSGRWNQAVELLTEAIRLSPWVWQGFQYRGELYLLQPDSLDLAVADFSEAIRLAPGEPHLYTLRGHAYGLLGDEAASRMDYETAAALGGTPAPVVARPETPSEPRQ